MTTMKIFILCGLFSVIKSFCSNGDPDINGNGAVTQSEMMKYFRAVDTNKDKKWSTMEYGQVETVDEMSSVCRKIFKELDKMDGVEDNSILQSSVLALFNALDQDGDGIIMPPEQFPVLMKRKDRDIWKLAALGMELDEP